MSNSGNIGRPWTPYEDGLLTEAVHKYGENTEKWKTIALSVPGRTNKACRKRWLHSLSPSVKKSAWTSEEDQLLLSLFERYPNKWSQIAREIPGRTDDACSKRYREALDPNLKKDEWTEDEDKRLLETLTRHGGPSRPKWGLIGQELRRSGLGCRNRWRLLERKRLASVRQTSSLSGNLPSQGMPNLFSVPVEDNAISFWDSSWDPSELGIPVIWQGQPTSELSLPLNKVAMFGQPESSALMEHRSDYFRPSSIQTNLIAQQASEGGNFSSMTFSDTFSHHHILRNIGQPIIENLPLDMTFSETMDSDYHLQPQSTDNQLTIEVPTVEEDSQLCCGDSFVVHNSENTEDVTIINTDASDLHINTVGLESEVSSASPEDEGAYFPVPSPLPDPSLLNIQDGSSRQQGASQEQENHLAPLKKRRRTVTNGSSFRGVHIMSITVGDPKAPPKLSSSLPVSNDCTILAYACGHKDCWPVSCPKSKACYTTSGELLAHFKDHHISDLSACELPPFRCGLKDCGKGWKSINGLQYHLQISKVHYVQVLGAARPKNSTEEGLTSRISPSLPNEEITKSKRRVHRCTFTGCGKEYKQLSGLRYHILHGHPNITPAQLDALPPTIASKLSLESKNPQETS